MIINREKKVLLCQRIDKKKLALQMPQGGVDQGETDEQALYRELQEELGSDNFVVLGRAKKVYKYKFPNYVLRNKSYKVSYMGQQQTWFLLFFPGQSGDLDVANVEHPEFVSCSWCKLDDVPFYAVKFKQQMYSAVVGEFRAAIAAFDPETFVR